MADEIYYARHMAFIEESGALKDEDFKTLKGSPIEDCNYILLTRGGKRRQMDFWDCAKSKFHITPKSELKKDKQMCGRKIISGDIKADGTMETHYEDDKASSVAEPQVYNVHVSPASSRQVGGYHYKDYKESPYKFLYLNEIPHHKAAIIRRILRYDHPTGDGIKDLRKIQHEIELIIEYGNLKDPCED